MQTTLDPTEQRSQFALRHIGTNKVVLDVGCADGSFAKIFTENGNRVYGIEIDNRLARAARRYCRKVACVDVRKGLPFEDYWFDVLFAGEFIEHLSYEDGLKFLVESRRVLRKRGILILTTPNTDFLKHKIVNRNTYAKEEHVKCYNPSELRKLATKAGFKIVAVEGLGVMRHWFGNGLPLFCYGSFGVVMASE